MPPRPPVLRKPGFSPHLGPHRNHGFWRVGKAAPSAILASADLLGRHYVPGLLELPGFPLPVSYTWSSERAHTHCNSVSYQLLSSCPSATSSCILRRPLSCLLASSKQLSLDLHTSCRVHYLLTFSLPVFLPTHCIRYLVTMVFCLMFIWSLLRMPIVFPRH